MSSCRLKNVIAYVLLTSLASAEDNQRLPEPQTEARARASDRITEIFQSDVEKANTVEAKAIVAKKLIDFADEGASPTEKFVLLEAAESLATKAGDAKVALAALARRSEMFQIDATVAKAELLGELAKTAHQGSAGIVIDALLAAASADLSIDNVEEAKAKTQSAITAARRSKDKRRQKDIADLMEAIRVRSKEIDKVRPWLDRLAGNKDDGEALDFVGKHYCFETERWDLGLPFLARGTNQELAALAKADLSAGQDENARLTVGDTWCRYADQVKRSVESKACLRRAEYHYQAAIPLLAGLRKAKTTQALDIIGKKIGSNTQDWITVFRGDDPRIWNTKTDEGFARYATPLSSLPNNVSFVRIRRRTGEEFIVGMTKDRLAAVSFDGRYGWNGSGQQMYDDVMLGVIDGEMRIPSHQSKVAIAYRVEGKADGIFGGWGFGHSQLSGTKQDFAWGSGDTLPPEPIEISVLCRDLSPKEVPRLLR